MSPLTMFNIWTVAVLAIAYIAQSLLILFQNIGFDWTINFGNVLTGLVLLLGFMRAHQQNISRLDKIEERIDLIYKWWVNNIVVGQRPDGSSGISNK